MKNYNIHNFLKVFLNTDEEDIRTIDNELEYNNINSIDSENKILNIIESAKAELEIQRNKIENESFEKVY